MSDFSVNGYAPSASQMSNIVLRLRGQTLDLAAQQITVELCQPGKPDGHKLRLKVSKSKVTSRHIATRIATAKKHLGALINAIASALRKVLGIVF